MIDLLEKTWSKGKLPIIHGIVKSNGLYYEIENVGNIIKVIPPVMFSFDFAGDDFSDINPFFEVQIGEYTLYCGEGSWGAPVLYISKIQKQRNYCGVFLTTQLIQLSNVHSLTIS